MKRTALVTMSYTRLLDLDLLVLCPIRNRISNAMHCFFCAFGKAYFNDMFYLTMNDHDTLFSYLYREAPKLGSVENKGASAAIQRAAWLLFFVCLTAKDE